MPTTQPTLVRKSSPNTAPMIAGDHASSRHAPSRHAPDTPTAANDDDPLVAHIEFRGVDYVISLVVNLHTRHLVVDVEDNNTTDHWTGQYDGEC